MVTSKNITLTGILSIFLVAAIITLSTGIEGFSPLYTGSLETSTASLSSTLTTSTSLATSSTYVTSSSIPLPCEESELEGECGGICYSKVTHQCCTDGTNPIEYLCWLDECCDEGACMSEGSNCGDDSHDTGDRYCMECRNGECQNVPDDEEKPCALAPSGDGNGVTDPCRICIKGVCNNQKDGTECNLGPTGAKCGSCLSGECQVSYDCNAEKNDGKCYKCSHNTGGPDPNCELVCETNNCIKCETDGWCVDQCESQGYKCNLCEVSEGDPAGKCVYQCEEDEICVDVGLFTPKYECV